MKLEIIIVGILTLLTILNFIFFVDNKLLFIPISIFIITYPTVLILYRLEEVSEVD